jgi:ABC-type nitrate/sulfonate/bicarbonate transport system substrate-binding protein
MRWHRRVNRARLRRHVAAVALAALAASMGAARAGTDHAVVSLPAEGVQFLPIYIAEDTGLYAGAGLEVKRVNLPGVATTNGVISGSVDFGFSNGASITRAAARGQHLVAIALMTDRPNWSILLRTDEAEAAHFDPKAPLADRARLMAGRRFAVDSIQSVAHALERVIAKAGGLDPDAIAVSPLVATEAIAALQRKAIDGMVIASPWREVLEANHQAVVIADTLAGDPPWLSPFAAGLIITRVLLRRASRRLSEDGTRAGAVAGLPARSAGRRVRHPQDAFPIDRRRGAKARLCQCGGIDRQNARADRRVGRQRGPPQSRGRLHHRRRTAQIL